MDNQIRVILLILLMGVCNVMQGQELKIMEWNIWGRLNQEPRYTINGKTARTRMIEVIQESQADIIAMIETYGSAADIAKALNYYHYTPSADANLAIFSRYPLQDFGTIKDLSPWIPEFVRESENQM